MIYAHMDGWLIVFIILCVVYLPLYVSVSLIVLAAIAAPGTDWPGYTALGILVGAAPLVYVGWRAFS